MKLNTARDIGSLVRQVRNDRGWTQQQLADRVGVSRDWIIRLEQGRATVELSLVLRTLKALDISLRVDMQSAESSEAGFDLDEILNPDGKDQ